MTRRRFMGGCIAAATERSLDGPVQERAGTEGYARSGAPPDRNGRFKDDIQYHEHRDMARQSEYERSRAQEEERGGGEGGVGGRIRG